MNNNIIILPTIIPIIFALFTVFIANNFISRLLFFTSSLLNSFVSSLILFSFLEKDDFFIEYFVGGIDPIIGISLKAYFLNSSILLLINICSLIISIYIIGGRNKDSFKFTEGFLILIFISGMNGILFSNDIFNIFVFLEISSIASYALVINERNSKSSYTAFNYLIMGSISASFYLIGIIFLYNQFGFLNIDIISKIINLEKSDKIPLNILLAGFFILIGFFMKFGIFPVHKYMIEVYQKSSSHITSIFSSISSKINFYLIYVSFFIILKFSYFEKTLHIGEFIAYFGLLSSLFFTIYANKFNNHNLKKILTISSFAEMSYMLSLFIFHRDNFHNKEIQNIMMQLFFNHSFSKIGLFLFFESFFSQKFLYLELKKENNDNSLYKKYIFKNWQKKLLEICFLILIFHSIGIPPLLGFIGKFSLIFEFFKSEKYYALIIFLLIIFFSVLYNLKIFFSYFISKNHIYKEEIDDKKISFKSFKIVDFYFIFTSLLISIFCLFFSLFIF